MLVMKNYFLILLSLAFFICTSCTKNDSIVNVKQLVSFKSETTNEPIAGAVVHVEIAIKKISGSYIYNEIADSFTTKTDADGNLHLNVAASNDPNAFIAFYKSSDDYTTGIISLKNSYLVSDLLQHPVTFYVRKYLPLVITVKNIQHHYYPKNFSRKLAAKLTHTSFSGISSAQLKNSVELLSICTCRVMLRLI